MPFPSFQQLAKEWIHAWNSHDLDAILAHYAEQIEFSSPFIQKIIGEPSGKITGKQDLRSYFAKALQAYPDLHFKLIEVLSGVQSGVIYYQSVNNLLAAEVMFFDANQKITQVFAHYYSKT